MTFIIAEAGSNTCGDFHLAKEMILAADLMGADAIKFQALPSSVRNSWAPRLKEIADDVAVELMVTPFDRKAVDAWDPYVKRWKIASAELVNEDLLEYVARTDKPMLVSTGMATQEEVSKAYMICWKYCGADYGMLQCTAAYPTPYEHANLSALMGNEYVGLSDHTLGTHVPIAAAALGAEVIEKHFRLEPEGYLRANFRGDPRKSPDYDFALGANQFAYMVRCIRDVEKALGDGIKRPMPGEAYEARGRRLESA